MSDYNQFMTCFVIKEFYILFRPIEIDYDTDDSGLYKAKGVNEITRDAKVILDSTVTKIDKPLDLMETQQIDEEQLSNQVQKFRIDWKKKNQCKQLWTTQCNLKHEDCNEFFKMESFYVQSWKHWKRYLFFVY